MILENKLFFFLLLKKKTLSAASWPVRVNRVPEYQTIHRPADRPTGWAPFQPVVAVVVLPYCPRCAPAALDTYVYLYSLIFSPERIGSYCVVVSTLDFESKSPGSNPGSFSDVLLAPCLGIVFALPPLFPSLGVFVRQQRSFLSLSFVFLFLSPPLARAQVDSACKRTRRKNILALASCSHAHNGDLQDDYAVHAFCAKLFPPRGHFERPGPEEHCGESV